MTHNRTAIITGASGFIGRAVVKELLQNGYEVYAVVRNGSESKLPCHPNCHIVPCNMEHIGTLSRIISLKGAKYFFHFAWDGCSGESRFDVELQLKNVLWTVEACKIAKALGCDKIIVSGTIMEKETLAATYQKGNKPGLGYIYGGAKVAAHTMAMSVCAAQGIDLVWASITNAYGVGEKSPRLLNSTIQKCINKINPQFTSGLQNYDFIYIDDVARAFRLIAERGHAYNEYVISSGGAKPLRQFLLELKAAIAPDRDFLFGDIPYTGVNLSISEFDNRQLCEDTGFKAEVSFMDGCKKTYNWLKSLDQLEDK